MGTILLFYKYVDIQYPQQVVKWQRRLCESLGLKGRVLIAAEGINGTLGGTEQAAQAYVQAMNEHPLFGGIDFKTSPGDANHFPRLRIVERPEIVRLGLDTNKVRAENGGIHLTPEQVHELMQEHPEDLVVLDCRNEYESRIGTFVGSIKPPTKTFREFPAYVDKHPEVFKDKQVLMFCTGGIRCERASTYVKEKSNAKKVYQILGGIHRYIEKFPNGFFRGKNYVFDGRIAVKANDDILATCEVCATPCDDFTNCINASCNKQYISCEPCVQKTHNCCSQTCIELTQAGKVPLRTKPSRTQVVSVHETSSSRNH